ncbi:extracellular solute-binding protein [Patescibacteria group bacterium]|nr:extracellular solute-binding protein [Patescibacteria group bacterium]
MKKPIQYLPLFLAISLLLGAASCRPLGPSTNDGDNQSTFSFPKEDVTLTYYRLWDEDDVLDDIIASYREEHKNVTISVRKIAIPEDKTIYDYQNDLIKQIADGEGPDIFMIHNDWLPYQINQISPMSSSIMALDTYQQKYPQVIVSDFIDNNKIYAIPFYVDNLMLFYNVDLFSDARIPREKTPPKTWSDVIDIVPKLTTYNTDGSIKQSGITLGTDDNFIPRFAEIIAALITQYGGEMTSADHTKATFNLPVNADKPYYPSENALKFYTDFANPNSSLYTYSDTTYADGTKKFPGDIQAFMEGKAAMFIGYSYNVENIKKFTGRSFSFATTNLPQLRLESPVTIANYWGETVSKNSKYPQVAWDFLKYASQRQQLRSYLNNTGRVSSLKDSLDNYSSSAYLAPVADQIKYSQSWYRSNTSEVEKIFAKMVNNVLHNNLPYKTAIELATTAINNLTSQPWSK